jgi:transcriptional regulator with XRE-family HTH domain
MFDINKTVLYNIIVRKERMHMANQIFGTRVKYLREKSGLSMEQLAANLGVSKSRVNMWENNGTIPRGDVLIQLAKYFEVSTDYLLGNDDDSAISESNAKLSSLQRNLGKLNEADLNRAEGMLKAVFMDIFNDEEDDDDI